MANKVRFTIEMDPYINYQLRLMARHHRKTMKKYVEDLVLDDWRRVRKVRVTRYQAGKMARRVLVNAARMVLYKLHRRKGKPSRARQGE
jgi:hypothetical protein